MPPWGKDPDSVSLTAAFRAMSHFLARQGGGSPEVTALLKRLAGDDRGNPASEALWQDFRQAVDDAERERPVEPPK